MRRNENELSNCSDMGLGFSCVQCVRSIFPADSHSNVIHDRLTLQKKHSCGNTVRCISVNINTRSKRNNKASKRRQAKNSTSAL
jgi:hypothetical protein